MAGLLQKTRDEEREADEKRTAIAARLNAQAVEEAPVAEEEVRRAARPRGGEWRPARGRGGSAPA